MSAKPSEVKLAKKENIIIRILNAFVYKLNHIFKIFETFCIWGRLMLLFAEGPYKELFKAVLNVFFSQLHLEL